MDAMLYDEDKILLAINCMKLWNALSAPWYISTIYYSVWHKLFAVIVSKLNEPFIFLNPRHWVTPQMQAIMYLRLKCEDLNLTEIPIHHFYLLLFLLAFHHKENLPAKSFKTPACEAELTHIFVFGCVLLLSKEILFEIGHVLVMFLIVCTVIRNIRITGSYN